MTSSVLQQIDDLRTDKHQRRRRLINTTFGSTPVPRRRADIATGHLVKAIKMLLAESPCQAIQSPVRRVQVPYEHGGSATICSTQGLKEGGLKDDLHLTSNDA
jgi:hypothetical protein